VLAFCQLAKETVASVCVDEVLAKQASLRGSEIIKFSSIAAVNELLTAEALQLQRYFFGSTNLTVTYILVSCMEQSPP
jgi:hypothetical protein